MRLVGKVGLITGGTKGIGAATALTLAREGADVAIVGRHDDQEAARTKSQVEAQGRRCEIIVADCGKAAEARRCVTETAKQFGSVDVLVHAAGGPVTGS